jgi:hypothetical protein
VPRSSNAPAPNAVQERVRPELEPLVRELAALPPAVRRSVFSAAEQAAEQAKPIVTWDEFDRARGVVSLGGNAVDDCDNLYDGT